MTAANAETWFALNADVVGYSALVADDVEATSVAITEAHRFVSEIVERYGGTLANFVGDSFMAVFREATAALGAAIAIAGEAERHNTGLPKARHLVFRMGMDQGEVRFADGNHHGDALNIAARIQAIARPGGLAVSGRVYAALDEPALRFRAMGRQGLKNIPERVAVYEYVDLPAGARGLVDRRKLGLEAPTLAVLPIHTEGVDDEVRALAALIRRDLLHRLASIPELRVIDAPVEPGPGTGVSARYMLETGVHQFGRDVRIFGTLFDMGTMNVVKSHRWSLKVDDLFAHSETMANDVARSVEVDLVVGAPAELYAELHDPQAIERVYLGWYHLRNDTAEGWSRAMDLFGDVARAHPNSPYGHVLLAFGWWLGAANRFTSDGDAALRRATTLAERAAAAGDPTGMSQAVQAAVLMSQGNVEAAMEKLERLEIERPTCDITYALEGSLRRYLGQWEQAIELLDVAMRLTGINKPWYPTVKASTLFLSGQLEDAASLAEAVLEYQPNNLEALLVLVACQQELGLTRRSQATAALIRERFPAVDVEEWLDHTPYQRREVVERWKDALTAAGAIEAA